MLSDEIPISRALGIALSGTRDAIRLHELLRSKLGSRVLLYQYDALLHEIRRHEHELVRAVREHGDIGDVPDHSPFLGRLPDAAALATMAPPGLLEVIAGHQERLTTTCADLASRVIDEKVKTLLEELSEAAFVNKTKALTDLHLMRKHPDYN